MTLASLHPVSTGCLGPLISQTRCADPPAVKTAPLKVCSKMTCMKHVQTYDWFCSDLKCKCSHFTHQIKLMCTCIIRDCLYRPIATHIVSPLSMQCTCGTSVCETYLVTHVCLLSDAGGNACNLQLATQLCSMCRKPELGVNLSTSSKAMKAQHSRQSMSCIAGFE